MGKSPKEHVLFLPVACKHDVVRDAFEERGWRKCSKKDVPAMNWDIAWADSPAALFSMLTTSNVLAHQRMNHFPLMQNLCRKDLLALNCREVEQSLCAGGSEVRFDYLPTTWICPADMVALYAEMEQHFERQDALLQEGKK